MLPEPRRRTGARSRRFVARLTYRHAFIALSLLVGWILVSPAEAEFPFSRGGSTADPTSTTTAFLTSPMSRR
jgi:hypothetical protein